MKSKLIIFIIISLAFFAGNASAKEVEFQFDGYESGETSDLDFLLGAKGVAKTGGDLTSVEVLDLEITNNPVHGKVKWIDYVSVVLAYKRNDGGWAIAESGPQKMINKILKPGEKFELKGGLSTDFKVSQDKLKKYWVVLAVGTNDDNAVYMHSKYSVFGSAAEGSYTRGGVEKVEELDELSLRRFLELSALHDFENENFKELNDDFDRYWRWRQRTNSGTWYLTFADIEIRRLNLKTTSEWDELEAKSKRWIDYDPSKPSGYITYANTLIFYAWWHARSSSPLPDLIKNTIFNTYIKKAEDFLLENKTLLSEDPRWYEAMFLVATAQKWDLEKFTRLEDKAFSKFPYYYQLYFVAFDYHSPGWHGNDKAVNDFAKKAVRYTAEKDKGGMYARVYWFASQRYYGSKIFTDSKVAWRKMSQGIDDVLAQYPDQWNINNFAYFSCLAGDAEKTKKLILKIDPEPIHTVWRDGLYERCKDWAVSVSVN